MELKFKAWHRTEKKMYWFDLMWGNHGHGDGYIGMVEWGKTRENKHRYNGNQQMVDPAECEIFQFTGEKDKTGKEVCRGDIVKESVPNYEYDEIDNPNVPRWIERVSKIVYRNHGFWVEGESFGWEGEDLWNWENMEVVGNTADNECENCKGGGTSEVYQVDSEIVKGEVTCSECNGSGFVIE